MKLLLDHCVPKRFGRQLVGHEVRTAYQMGWANVSNGALLAEAAKQFDALITIDTNMRYQQNLRNLPLPVIMLMVGDNDADTLKAYASPVLAALAGLPGKVLVCIYGDGRMEVVGGDRA